jgi:putative transposase
VCGIFSKKSGHGIPGFVTKQTEPKGTMTEKKSKLRSEEIKALMREDEDFLRPLMKAALQEVLEAEMNEAVGASKGERSAERQGYRSGYYSRRLITRVGTLELRVPQDRQGRFSTEVFERYQRSEKALVAALVEMYVQGVSTRKVKAISEELCGHEFSASTVSELNKRLDVELERFARQRLEEEYPYLVLDARYEKVRENGVVRSRAVLVAIGIDWHGRRRVIGVELANRESATSWKEFLIGLKERGLRGVRFVVSDQHEGLKRAVAEVLSEAAWQRCYVHFLRNALDYLPRKNADDCLMELRWLYDRRDVNEARQDLVAWLKRWSGKYPKLCAWAEENIEQTWTFYRLPRAHHKHMKSTNMLERLNQELKRRTHVIRIFPNEASCLRLIRALASETDDEWMDGACYLNMELLREQSKTEIPIAA